MIFFSEFCLSVCLSEFLFASEIFFSKLSAFVFSELNSVFLITSIPTASLHFLRSIETVFDLAAFKSSNFVFRLFRIVGALTNLLISSFPLQLSKQ